MVNLPVLSSDLRGSSFGLSKFSPSLSLVTSCCSNNETARDKSNFLAWRNLSACDLVMGGSSLWTGAVPSKDCWAVLLLARALLTSSTNSSTNYNRKKYIHINYRETAWYQIELDQIKAYDGRLNIKNSPTPRTDFYKTSFVTLVTLFAA